MLVWFGLILFVVALGVFAVCLIVVYLLIWLFAGVVVGDSWCCGVACWLVFVLVFLYCVVVWFW